MKPCAMRFNGFTWHHNPKELTIKCKDKMVKYGVPYFKEFVERSYNEAMVVSGVGELYGESCLEQYEKLEQLYKDGKCGILCLPSLRPFYACFEKLSVEASTKPSVLTYSFTFTQIKVKEDAVLLLPSVVLEKDCSLFEVSSAYDISIEKLVKLNENIMFINELKKGTVIRLC
ncbi:MAG: hypothetical protein IJ015_01500 [Ruminococcus sp.]|nr:hypothetical protein [Ruminococcus sp.]